MSDYDEQSARIQAVFNLDEIPRVNKKNLEHYLKWLKGQLTFPCLLTGIESIGYFLLLPELVPPHQVHSQ